MINHFHEETPELIRSILLKCQANNTRIRLFYGDIKTGKSWHEENDVCGTVGNSTGPQKIALLIPNARSYGGGGILTHCIVAIKAGDYWLYKHPEFNAGHWSIAPADLEGYESSVLCDSAIHARFKKASTAARYVQFMTGQRMGK
jgi:hypothetical protein